MGDSLNRHTITTLWQCGRKRLCNTGLRIFNWWISVFHVNGTGWRPLYMENGYPPQNLKISKVLRIGSPGGQNLSLACGSHLQCLIHRNRPFGAKIKKITKIHKFVIFSYSSLIGNPQLRQIEGLPAKINRRETRAYQQR